MRFFLDNCLSPKYATILGALDHGEVIHLRDRFPADTADEDWIPVVGAEGLVLISLDRRQMSKPAQREALKKAGVVAIYLAKAFDHFPIDDQVWRIVRFWPAISAIAQTAKKGSCYLVTVHGKVEPWRS